VNGSLAAFNVIIKPFGIYQPVTMIYQGVQRVGFITSGNYQQGWDETRCFPAHTRIQTSRTTSTAISALRVGDVVLAFDARADRGRGALVPRRVTRLYRNTTTDWLRLRWHDGAREVITTPGHHFLDELGGFPTIEEMTRTGSATVVLASGALTQVTAERIVYSAETAHLFERATGQDGVLVKVGNSDDRVSGAVEEEGLRRYGLGSVMGRWRRGKRSVHMRTVWKLMESQGSVNFCSSDISGNVQRSIRVGGTSAQVVAKIFYVATPPFVNLPSVCLSISNRCYNNLSKPQGS
jgi:hypothetical protein